MLSSVITLPLRISLSAARAAEKLAQRTVVSLIRSVSASPTGSAAAAETTPRSSAPPPSAPRPSASPRSAPRPSAPKPTAAPAAPAPSPVESAPSATETRAPAQPAHVPEQSELVAEFAEPGAEEGASAQINVAEPWDGYAGMRASEVIARIDGATAAELAVIELYESANRARQTVIAAVHRALETASDAEST